MRLKLVGLLAVLTMIVASCGGAGPEAAGPNEGIQVHGDWTIDIYNEDGSLDRQVEFSNALTSQGAEDLAEIMSGQATAGRWRIVLVGASTSPDPCPLGGFGDCLIAPIDAEWTGAPSLLLAGSVQVEATSRISSVSTVLGICDSSIAPANCVSSGKFRLDFTRHIFDVAEQVEVAAGQTVQVEVEISFTSG